MIKRLLIVLSIAAGIVFVPYLVGIVGYVINNFDMDRPTFVWLFGFVIIISLMAAGVLIISLIKDAIKYIIKGD